MEEAVLGTNKSSMNNNLQVLTNDSTDPSSLGWPASLPLEIALKSAPLSEIRATYNISDEEWETLKNNEQFRKAVLKCEDDAKEDGFSFKTKSKIQAEALLATSWALIHNEDTPAAVKADLIKFTTRIAGYEPNPKAANAGDTTPSFQININMGGQPQQAEPQMVTINPMSTISNSFDFEDMGEYE